MTVRLIIARHGNTFDPGDTVLRVGGRTDLPLSASGRAQAEALGRHLAEVAPALCSAITSPLKRTRQTAETMLAALADPPELKAALFLREIDYGPDEGQPEMAVIARIGQAALDLWETDQVLPPGWRADPDAIIANWQLLLSELAQQPGDHLAVTSNGVARFALAAAGHKARPGKLATGAMGVLAWTPSEAWSVEAWNVRPPLTPTA